MALLWFLTFVRVNAIILELVRLPHWVSTRQIRTCVFGTYCEKMAEMGATFQTKMETCWSVLFVFWIIEHCFILIAAATFQIHELEFSTLHLAKDLGFSAQVVQRMNSVCLDVKRYNRLSSFEIQLSHYTVCWYVKNNHCTRNLTL